MVYAQMFFYFFKNSTLYLSKFGIYVFVIVIYMFFNN